MHRLTVLLLTVPILTALLLTAPAHAQSPPAAPAEIKAPTRLHHEPATYLLLPMGGDRTRFYYVPGWLDRAANMQYRIELAARGFERWSGQRVEYLVYVLDREEWEKASFTVPYGVPLRVGKRGIAAPAGGDAGTVKLWRDLLGGNLPRIAGTPIRTSPEQLSSIVVSDQIAQILASEAFIDAVGLAGDAHWVRAFATHVASLSVVLRFNSDRVEDVSILYRSFLRAHPQRSLSLDDYNPDLGLADWLYFHAQFHLAARAFLDQTGKKDGLAKLEKLRKKNGGLLRGDVLRRKFDGLDAFLQRNFSAVRMR